MRDSLRPGDVVSGNFRIERELGRGAMGIIYVAHDERHARDVVVKTIDPQTRVGSAIPRFLDEIRRAAPLSHPNILPIHDSGELQGLPYYITPLIRGETLRDLLDRVERLPTSKALDITCQLASALAHAHRRGVVHRDVKPENVLLDGDHVYLADFGVAHSVAEDVRRTAEGTAVGSPLYMSPEQIRGDRSIDGRSDLYALACLLFEMLTGTPPFPGTSVAAVLTRHLHDEPPSVRHSRADVEVGVEQAIRRAMAKDRGERQRTVEEFSQALGLQPHVAGSRLGFKLNRTATVVVGGLAIVVGGWFAVRSIWALYSTPDGPARYAVAVGESTGADTSRAHQLVEGVLAVMGRWDDIELVDGPEFGERAETGSGSRASHYITIETRPYRDSVEVEANLRQIRGYPRLSRSFTLRTPVTALDVQALAARLAVGVLVVDRADASTHAAALVVRSLSALQDFATGHQKVASWDLPAADSLFRRAALRDSTFGAANLWVAQVGSWTGTVPAAWAAFAAKALHQSGGLLPREHTLATALAALAQGDYEGSCERYGDLRAVTESDFAAWYGLGECRRLDPRVETDSRSLTGWRFRSSYREAQEAYRRAFELFAVSRATFDPWLSEKARLVLFTRTDQAKGGQAPALPGELLVGYLLWQGDTLALIPYRQGTSPPAEARERALIRQRQSFHEMATAWSRTYPQDAEARFALSQSLEMLGAEAALDTLRSARRLGGKTASGLRMAAAEVWLLVKWGVPSRPEYLAAARVLADSLVRNVAPRSPTESRALAELATLIGRPHQAARLATFGGPDAGAIVGAQAPLVSIAAALEAYAAIGSRLDSVKSLESQAEDMLRRTVLPEDRFEIRSTLLTKAAILAYPDHVFRILLDSGATRSELARAQAFLEQGDSVSARKLIQGRMARREGRAAADISFDVTLPEALLLRATVGETQARELLKVSLDDLRWVQPGVFDQPGRIGATIRGTILLAEMDASLGHAPSSEQWFRVVEELWKDGEPDTRAFLRERMVRARG